MDDYHRKIVYIGDVIGSGLSLAGCSFIIVTYLLFPDIRGYPFKMILILTLFDFLNCIGFILPTYSSSGQSALCHIQAFLLNISTIAGIIWTSIIAYSMYSIFSKENSNIKKRFKGQILFVVVFSLTVGIIPEFTQAYGRTAGWCWIQFNDGEYNLHFFERLGMLFIPLCIAVFFNLYFYVKLVEKLKIIPDEVITVKEKMRFRKRILMYPWILVICYLPYGVKQVLEMTDLKQDYMLSLTGISGVMRALHGLFNAIIYGFTPEVKNQVRKSFRSMWIIKRNIGEYQISLKTPNY